MRKFVPAIILISMLVFIVSCTDQIAEPESPRSAGVSELLATPFQIDADAEKPGLSASKSIETTCTFTTVETTMYLDADCTTDGTIFVPDGITLNGNDFTITAVDPEGGFLGPVVANAGTNAHVEKVKISTAGLSDGCRIGNDRLRGILFDGASGSITKTTVMNINKGASGCQEGNGIEVRNAPFDGTHPGTVTVEVSYNVITDWQKGGIVANGDIVVDISHNQLSASATQANLAANSIQMGFGATGRADFNLLEGNQWLGCDVVSSDYVATGILIYQSDDVVVSNNTVSGNSDVGLLVFSSQGGVFKKNHFMDEGADAVTTCLYDYGIWDYPGTGNTYNKNHVTDFNTPFEPDPLPGNNNKVVF